MIRAFSQLELLQAEIGRLENKSFLDRAIYLLSKTTYVSLSINVQPDLILWGEALCEDIGSKYDDLEFTLSDLAELLFDDFLSVVRNDEDFEKLYSQLLAREPRITCPNTNYKTDAINESEVLSATLKIRLKRKGALRGEMVLCDLAEIFPAHEYTLESVLRLIMVDFLQDYKDRNGERNRIKKNILGRLEFLRKSVAMGNQ
ncbi:hypothetical protein ACFFIX_19715 [Metabacillus herbersteinensis]|uniref:Uncharacterized protein n=1 Tax=Metabacillus herbersteinensis TaxID=283816 RepID=A0ABV6GIU3_9BACI